MFLNDIIYDVIYDVWLYFIVTSPSTVLGDSLKCNKCNKCSYHISAQQKQFKI